MHERPTNNGGRQAAQEVHSQPEAGGLATPWDSSLDPVSLEEEIGAGGGGVSQRGPSQTKPANKGAGKRESEAQGHRDFAVSRPDALEKKDELGLTGRKSGQAYTQEQRQRILDTVEKLKSQRVSTLTKLVQLRPTLCWKVRRKASFP